MSWIYLFTSFDGRIGRKTFWIGSLTIVVVELILGFAALAIMAVVKGDWSIDNDWPLDGIALIFNYPQFAVDTKRGHDRNIPIWVPGAFFIYSVALDVASLLGWNPDNLYGDPLAFAVYAPYAVFGVALLIEFGFRKGTAGPNRFGRDPLAPKT